MITNERERGKPYYFGKDITMYAKLVRERLTQLRLQKGASEYKMSYELGHCKGYINNISSGKALPSLSEFFAICEYFEMTPLEFFDVEVQNPRKSDHLREELDALSEKDLHLVEVLISRLREKGKT